MLLLFPFHSVSVNPSYNLHNNSNHNNNNKDNNYNNNKNDYHNNFYNSNDIRNNKNNNNILQQTIIKVMGPRRSRKSTLNSSRLINSAAQHLPPAASATCGTCRLWHLPPVAIPPRIFRELT